MTEYADTPRGNLQRLKHKQAAARAAGIDVDDVPEPEPEPTAESTASLTKKKAKKKAG